MQRTGRAILLEVDGGVKADNIAAIAAAGADTFVAGSAIFGGARLPRDDRGDARGAGASGGRRFRPCTPPRWAAPGRGSTPCAGAQPQAASRAEVT